MKGDPTMIRTIAVLGLVAVLASPALAEEGQAVDCLRHESAVERLQCLDVAVAAMKPEDSGLASVLLRCVEEASSLQRLDCFTDAIGQDSPPSRPAEGRIGVDFSLPRGYQPGGDGFDCSEAEAQRRRAEARERTGGIAVGVGGAMTAAAVILGALAIQMAEPDKETGQVGGLGSPEAVDRFLGLNIGAMVLGAGGGIAFGAADGQFRMAWVHGQLAEMETRRCGGGLSPIDRR